MKQQVLTHKLTVFIFTGLLFIYLIRGVAYAEELRFIEGEATTREIAENTAVGTNVGDPIKFSTNACRRFRLHGPDAGSFDIVRVYRGVQLKTNTTFDYETKNSYEVVVTAVSTWNSDTITVTINVINVNETPMFSEAIDGTRRIHRSIPENSAAGTNIGNPISAIDPDGSEDVLTYNLSGADASMFQIDSQVGQLRTKMPLDYEAFNSDPHAYSVNVQASDGTMSTETEVLIDVEPVNEFAPVFIEGESATREIHEKEEVGANIGTPVSSTDMDMGETLEYSLTDADPDVFEVDSSTGQLRTKTTLDYSTKPTYTVKVVVSDGSRIDSIVVTINILSDETVAFAPTIKSDRTASDLEPALFNTLDIEELQVHLQKLSAESDGSLKYQQAIALLESILESMRPDTTLLLANYPNPFNPETWIPYHLAKASHVQITIYDACGTVVRHLELGHQSVGYYTSRRRAAYWDGKNDFGERVASGIYFYQLQADTVSPLRKMVILK